jgi:hypothetical protein
MALYAQRIQRTAEKTANTLKAMQQERKAANNQAKELRPSAPLRRTGPARRLCYSPNEIKLALLRVTRLEEARARFSPAA